MQKYAKENSDRQVWLGDFYDKFGPVDYEGVSRTAEFHSSLIEDPNVDVLMGNHDIPYMYPNNRFLGCSGHSEYKLPYIEHYMSMSKWHKVKYYVIIGEWLISHAGIHPDFQIHGKSWPKSLEILEKDCRKDLQEGKQNVFVGAGASRGGFQNIGGINWLDFNDEFVPIVDIHQLVGHSSWNPIEAKKHEIKSKHNPELNSQNYCIDTTPGLAHIAFLEDNGKIWFRSLEEINKIRGFEDTV